MKDLEIKNLHSKYAASPKAFDIVYVHCEIIAKIAEQIIDRNNLSVEKDLIKTGALLHDIGAYKFIDANGTFNDAEYVKHGIEGYEFLKNEGWPENICRFAERHTGVGITKDEILSRKLPLPPKDYFAETLEERIIMYADKFHSKPGSFNSYEFYSNYVKKFGKEHQIKFKKFSDEFGIPELEPLIREYSHPVRK